MFWSVLSARSHLRRRARSEGGFGMIELLAAMTVMLIGIFAVFSRLSGRHRADPPREHESRPRRDRRLGDGEVPRDQVRLDRPREHRTSTPSSAASMARPTRVRPFYKTDSAASTTLTGAMDGVAADDARSLEPDRLSQCRPLPRQDRQRAHPHQRPRHVEALGGRDASNERGYLGYALRPRTRPARLSTWCSGSNVAACGTSPCTNKVATKTVTGADGRSYKVDTYITWKQITNSGIDSGPARQARERRRSRQRLALPVWAPRQRRRSTRAQAPSTKLRPRRRPVLARR